MEGGLSARLQPLRRPWPTRPWAPIISPESVLRAMMRFQVPYLPLGLLQLLSVNLIILGETPGTGIAPVAP
jgi:hypothetical protein